MHFEYTSKVKELIGRLQVFMDQHIYPNEHLYQEQVDKSDNRHLTPPIIKELRDLAKQENLWNIFLPEDRFGSGLSNLEYAPLAELMGRVIWASEVFNCNAPDTDNMEVLAHYGSSEQQDRWLQPLLRGEIQSGFAMTEPRVASSDATNIESSIVRDGDEYMVAGVKTVKFLFLWVKPIPMRIVTISNP